MQIHELKTWPTFYALVVNNAKHFEYRKNDRDYKANDLLILKEWDQVNERYTGNSQLVQVVLVLSEVPGLPEGYCIMEIKKVKIETM